MKALVVEDHEIDTLIITKALLSLGIASTSATNGLEGWNTLMADPDFDIVITDYAMPIMNGEQLVKSIRASAALAYMPIIIVSAYVKFNQISHILEVGASRFIAKPLDVAEIRYYTCKLLGLPQYDQKSGQTCQQTIQGN